MPGRSAHRGSPLAWSADLGSSADISTRVGTLVRVGAAGSQRILERSSCSGVELSAGQGGGVECEASGGSTQIRLGDVKPKPRAEKQTAKARFGDSKIEISVGEPTMDTSGGDTFFPGEGKQTVIIPVTMKAVGGSTNVAPLNFGLVDGRDFACANDVLSKVVPKSQEIPIEVLKENDSVSGKMAYAIPAGADLGNFTLVFAEDYSTGRATQGWKLK